MGNEVITDLSGSRTQESDWIRPMEDNMYGMTDTGSSGVVPEESSGPVTGTPSSKEELRERIRDIRRQSETPVEEKRMAMGQIIVDYLNAAGGRMLQCEMSGPILVFGGTNYSVKKSDYRFAALLQDIARVNTSSAEGRHITQWICNHILLAGQPVRSIHGIHTDLAGDTIYTCLGNPGDEIIRVSPKEVGLIGSGQMPQGVLLLGSDMEPVRYDSEVNVREAMGLLKELVFDNLPCCKGDRYFILGWVLTAFLRDYARNRTILKLSGGSDSGKSTAAKLITTLVTGRPDLEASRVVRDLFIRGSVSPVLVLENLEARDITTSLLRFMLCAASGVNNTRRKLYTNSERITDGLNCLLCVTSIDPFRILELVNRSFSVEMSREHFGAEAFDETAVIRRIGENRSRILSALFRVMADMILPELGDTRDRIMRYLRTRHRGHFTQRCDESTVLSLIWARVLQGFFERVDDSQALLDSWVVSQDRRGRHMVQETSPLASLFAILRNEYESLHPEEFRQKHGLKIQAGSGEGDERMAWFECPTRDLLPAVLGVARKYGIRHSYKDPGTLAARLRSEQDTLAEVGWRIEWGVRTVRGTKIHRFSFVLETAAE